MHCWSLWGSYWFLDPKFKTFPDFFFFQTQGYQNRWSKESLNNAVTKLFSWCTAKVRLRLKKISPKRKKKRIKPAGCSFEKNSRLFTFFPDWSLFSRLFPVLENAGQINFKTFSRIQDYVSPVPRVKSRILDRGSDCSE